MTQDKKKWAKHILSLHRSRYMISVAEDEAQGKPIKEWDQEAIDDFAEIIKLLDESY